MEKLDIPPVDEFLEMITAGGGEIYACKLAMDMFKLKKEDLHDEVSGVLTVGDFYGMCGGENTQIIFTWFWQKNKIMDLTYLKSWSVAFITYECSIRKHREKKTIFLDLSFVVFSDLSEK